MFNQIVTQARWSVLSLLLALPSAQIIAGDENRFSGDEIRASVVRSISLLEKASAGTAEKRVCFTCHGQALPVFALVEAKRHEISIDGENLKRQIQHTHAHLKRGKNAYAKGKGQGGGVDTAGYALWTLEDGGHESDDVTAAVGEYLLQMQKSDGRWKCSSDRPPSESSDFTTTYLALRGLSAFSSESQDRRFDTTIQKAAAWLIKAEPSNTEDVVFGLLSTNYVELPNGHRDSLLKKLLESQRSDGGWAQKPNMDSDAYATGTVLYGLHRAGISHEDPVWKRGIRYLLDTQKKDGSWHVTTRSKPFQKYFETGFPHGNDQFVSTSATAWATLAILLTMPSNDEE